MIDRLQQYGIELWWLWGAALVLFVVTLAAIPWLIARLPCDYFIRPRRHARDLTIGAWGVLVFRNLVGLVLVLLGFAMLVLPGQGILTILIGLGFLQFPGRRRLERWLVSKKSVHRSMNWIRAKAGREPLQLPTSDEPRT
ncbi:MAG: hypothetical protein D8M59_05290 [Planctomycetes bacterium]|nr:hypothetical protein [Planctomycetota bacterium]NOG56005.1 hypothetical protein [Planctomycetota bacterium]